MNENNALWVGDPDGEMRRHRSNNADARGVTRSMRRAELVCAKAGNRLVATVFPVGVRAEFLQVSDGDNDVTALGIDLLISCRCGLDHQVEGARFRTAVLNAPSPRRGRPPTIEITDVTT